MNNKPRLMNMAALLESFRTVNPMLGHNQPTEEADTYHLIQCPHCQGEIQVYEKDIRCTIFRHGVYKSTGEQMNPHTPKEECDRAAEEERIIGCGKPFRFDGKEVSICGYI